MDNGLKVVFKPLPEKGLVSFYVKIKAGSGFEGRYAGTGITHFIEHMIFKGSEQMSENTLVDKVRIAGGHINAATTPDSTTFFVSVTSDNIFEIIDLLCEAIMEPAFDKEDFEKERDVIINEIRIGNDNPSREISKRLFDLAFIYSSYRFPIIGYEELFKTLSHDDLVNYHKRYYVPNNMVISIAGDMDVQKALERIRTSFGSYHRALDPVATNQKEPSQLQKRVGQSFMPINLAYMNIGFHSCSILNPDIYALNVLDSILGNGDSSILNTEIVKNKKLAFNVSSYNYSLLYDGLFIIGGIFLPENKGKIESEIFGIIDRIKNGELDDDVIEKAKNQIVSSYLNSLQSASLQASQMALGLMFLGNDDFSEKFVDEISKVKKTDVIEAAQKYLTENNMCEFTIFPDSLEKKDIEQLKQIQETNPVMIKLDNGIRVILRERKNVPIASISFLCLGGLREETETNNGISNLMAGLLLKGTKNRNEDHITSVLEQKGAYINSSSSLDCFSVNVDCQSKDLFFCMEILQDIILEPLFPEEEFLKAVDRTKGLIKKENDSAFQIGYKAMKKGLFGQSPYAMDPIGTENSLSTISVSQIKEIYEKQLVPDNIVISIVGDIDVEQTQKEVKKYFEKIPKKKRDVLKDISSTQLSVEDDVQINMDKEASVYVIGFKGADLNNDDKYALDVLFSCMTGAGGRLFNVLRKDNALTYSQGGYSVSVVDDGFCYFYIYSSAETISKAKKILIEQIDRIFKDPFTSDEINAAKKTLIFDRKSAMQINSSQALLMASDELFGQGYDSYLDYSSRINSVNREDVMRVAKNYLDLTDSVSVTVKPQEV
ncbi:MAG: pitrilysin family protein [Candidatus Omnitrophica bacterium]|nr:pitrilysin family protein [Candidatus Omnitrophota bacterium]